MQEREESELYEVVMACYLALPTLPYERCSELDCIS